MNTTPAPPSSLEDLFRDDGFEGAEASAGAEASSSSDFFPLGKFSLPKKKEYGSAHPRFWYKELMERMILDPRKTQRDHARELGVTEQIVHKIVTTDMFQKMIREHWGRRGEMLEQRIGRRMDESIEKGLTVVESALEKSDCDPGFALTSVVQLDKRRRGDKVQQTGTAQTTVNIAIGAEDLAAARAIIQTHARNGHEPSQPGLDPDSDLAELACVSSGE